MSATEIAALLSSGCSLLALLVAIWAKLTARQAKDIEQLRSEQDDEKRRLASIEATLEQMPRAELVLELRVELAKMDGRLNLLSEQLRPIGLVSTRLQDWLLENYK